MWTIYFTANMQTVDQQILFSQTCVTKELQVHNQLEFSSRCFHAIQDPTEKRNKQERKPETWTRRYPIPPPPARRAGIPCPTSVCRAAPTTTSDSGTPPLSWSEGPEKCPNLSIIFREWTSQLTSPGNEETLLFLKHQGTAILLGGLLLDNRVFRRTIPFSNGVKNEPWNARALVDCTGTRWTHRSS